MVVTVFNWQLKTVTTVIYPYGPQVLKATADVNGRLKMVITIICRYGPQVSKAAAEPAPAALALPNLRSPPFCRPRSVCASASAAATRYHCFRCLCSHRHLALTAS